MRQFLAIFGHMIAMALLLFVFGVTVLGI